MTAVHDLDGTYLHALVTAHAHGGIHDGIQIFLFIGIHRNRFYRADREAGRAAAAVCPIIVQLRQRAHGLLFRLRRDVDVSRGIL